MQDRVPLADMVERLKSVAEPTRLRILMLLSRGDLTVTDITSVLGQSQPRVSRHLKLLLEAGLIARHQEGAWALFRLTDSGAAGDLVASLIARIDAGEGVVERDMERLAVVKSERQRRAAEYFTRNAASWDEIRRLHVDDRTVEQRLLKLVGRRPVQDFLDMGTGTGRMLELFAPLYRRGVGIDASRDMLNVARANLDRAGVGHAHVQLGDVFALPVERGAFDLVIIHQVLHYLEDPFGAVREAARALAPSGRLVIVDFAPHDLEFLRESHAHQRLGFADDQVAAWIGEAGLTLEAVDRLAPGKGAGGLTVTIWLARDPRLLLANPTSNATAMELA